MSKTSVYKYPNRPTTLSHGFTLIELMVAVVIVSILAALAYPSYVNYVTATRRTDGISGIMRLAQMLEKYNTQCGQYTTNITGAGASFVCPGSPGAGLNQASANSPDSQYTLAIAATIDANTGAQVGYTITATPVGAQATRDTDCGVLSYNNVGVKTVSGTKTPQYCWKQQ